MRFRSLPRILIWTLLLTATVAPTPGDSELVLIDGRVLRGTDVRRDEEMYVLTLEDGSEIAMPEELVERVRLRPLDLVRRRDRFELAAGVGLRCAEGRAEGQQIDVADGRHQFDLGTDRRLQEQRRPALNNEKRVSMILMNRRITQRRLS